MVDAWMITGLDVPDLPLWRAARRNDPATSKAAARTAGGLRADHHRRIVEALRLGPAGATEIAARSGLDAHQVGKRLGELGRDGVIELTGREVGNEKGRREREWMVRA